MSAIGAGCLLVPSLALGAFGAATIGSLAGLAALGITITAATLGRRAGLVTSVIAAATGAIGVLAAGQVVPAVLVMVAAAAGFGWTARIGANNATVVLPVALAFVVNEPASAGTSGVHPAILLAASVLVSGLLATLATGAALHRSGQVATLSALSHARTIGFIIQLALTSVLATAVSVSGHWGHAGGWLAMTPFLVIQPYVQDGSRKAIRRGVGTLGGFVIAMGFATLLGNSRLLVIVGIAFAAGSVMAVMRRWDYGIFAMLLTPAIIILEGLGSVQATAISRLEATLIGIGLSLLAMAIAWPFYRRGARRNDLAHY